MLPNVNALPGAECHPGLVDGNGQVDSGKRSPHVRGHVIVAFGGVDEHGPSVYSVDAMGGATKEEDIVSTGSGSPMAYGVLEDRYKPDLKEEEATELAVRALRSAMKRDAGSGEGIHVVVITKEGYRELGEDQLKKYTAKNSA